MLNAKLLAVLGSHFDELFSVKLCQFVKQSLAKFELGRWFALLLPWCTLHSLLHLRQQLCNSVVFLLELPLKVKALRFFAFLSEPLNLLL